MAMADYVRRRIAPLLPGLEPEYLELIVGELEIATETRSGFSADPDDELEASVVEILQAAGYATGRAAAKAQCEQILLTLDLREGGSRLVKERAIAAAARGSASAEGSSSAAALNNSAPAPASSRTSTGAPSLDRRAPSDQPGCTLCGTPSAFAAVAIAAAAALTLLGSPKHPG